MWTWFVTLRTRQCTLELAWPSTRSLAPIFGERAGVRGRGLDRPRDDLPLPHPVPLHPRGRGWRGGAIDAAMESEAVFRVGCQCGQWWQIRLDVHPDAADAEMRSGTRWAIHALPRPVFRLSMGHNFFAGRRGVERTG